MTEAEPPKKVDPETLVLRAKPRRAVRFRRNLLIGAGAVGALGLTAVTWLALSPPAIKAIDVTTRPTPPPSNTRRPNDGLANLPATYSEVPQLGPPLPGDLGGPLLEAQRAHPERQVEHSPEVEQRGLSPAAAGKLTEAHSSGLFVAMSLRPEASITDKVVAVSTGNLTKSSVVIPAGTVISASLITGLNSDLPGIVLAQVTEPIYGVGAQRHLILPSGTRLIGRYERATGARQARIEVRWERIVLPDGQSQPLVNTVASDEAGFAGLADRVDYHLGQLAKGVGLSTILALADRRSDGDEGDLTRAMREAAGRTLNQTGTRIVEQHLAQPSTITVRPGWPVRIILTTDLALQRAKGGLHG